jgi:hypothetical protein
MNTQDIEHAEPIAKPRLLWEQQPDESPSAFAAFTAYLELGPDITLEQVAEKTARSAEAVRKMSSRHHWSERAASWRQHLSNAVLATVERAAVQHPELWSLRQQVFQQQQWERNQKISLLCDHALNRLIQDPDAKVAPYELARLLQLVSSSAPVCPASAAEPENHDQPNAEDPILRAFRTALHTITRSQPAADGIPAPEPGTLSSGERAG